MSELQRMTPGRAAALAATAAALALAGCGGSSHHKASSTAAGAPTPSTPATTSTAVTSSRTSTAAGTRAAGPPATAHCVAASLTLSFLGQQGATGHGVLGFALRNASGHTCRTFGYPGVEFLDAGGRGLPTRTLRTTHDFAGSAPVTTLTLAPGQSASFRIVATDFGAACTTAAALQVIPPDDTATLRTDIADGAYQCGSVTVTPLRPGSSAYPS